MNRRAAMLIVLFSALCFAAGAHAATRFSFKIPRGWTDLSPTAPPENFRDIPAEVLVELKGGKYTAFAMDVAHADDGYGENLGAIVGPGSQAITERVLDEAVAAMSQTEMTTVLEHEITEIDGVDVGRVVADQGRGRLHERMLVYFLPGDGEHAVLTYSAAPETFDEYLPIFEAAAAQTQGVAAVSFWESVFRGSMNGAIWGALFGGIGAAAAAIAVARLRKAKQARSG